MWLLGLAVRKFLFICSYSLFSYQFRDYVTTQEKESAGTWKIGGLEPLGFLWAQHHMVPSQEHTTPEYSWKINLSGKGQEKEGLQVLSKESETKEQKYKVGLYPHFPAFYLNGKGVSFEHFASCFLLRHLGT